MLDIADLDGLAQAGEGVAGGKEFVGDVTGEVCGGDGFHNRGVLNLLAGVDFVAAGYASRVEVSDDADVGADRVDQIPLHDLHMVDVVEQFHAG